MNLGGVCVKKKWMIIGMTGVLLLTLAACSNPKRDAIDTNIQEQMEQGTLDRS